MTFCRKTFHGMRHLDEYDIMSKETTCRILSKDNSLNGHLSKFHQKMGICKYEVIYQNSKTHRRLEKGNIIE